MAKIATTVRFVTFTRWCVTKTDRTPVTINPAEVSDVVDYCGPVMPGSQITMKNKKTFMVYGLHADIIAALRGTED